MQVLLSFTVIVDLGNMVEFNLITLCLIVIGESICALFLRRVTGVGWMLPRALSKGNLRIGLLTGGVSAPVSQFLIDGIRLVAHEIHLMLIVDFASRLVGGGGLDFSPVAHVVGCAFCIAFEVIITSLDENIVLISLVHRVCKLVNDHVTSLVNRPGVWVRVVVLATRFLNLIGAMTEVD